MCDSHYLAITIWFTPLSKYYSPKDYMVLKHGPGTLAVFSRVSERSRWPSELIDNPANSMYASKEGFHDTDLEVEWPKFLQLDYCKEVFGIQEVYYFQPEQGESIGITFMKSGCCTND